MSRLFINRRVSVWAVAVLVAVCGLWSTPAAAQSLPSECASFTDPSLTTTTPVKAVHFMELRACVSALRGQAFLSTVTWTDSDLLTIPTNVKEIHLTELRTALGAVYAAYGFDVPSYTDGTIKVGETTLKRAHVSELRAAATALDLPSAATPSFSPSPGTFSTSQSLTLSSTTSGAAIRYTLDGSEPTIVSSLYESPIPLDATTTVRAKTFAAGHLPSTINTGGYTFEVAAPSFSLAAGTYVGAQSITISSSTPSVTLRYTTDGSDPTASSTIYTSAITLNPISTTTIKARGFRSGWNPSAPSAATYVVTFQVAAPTFNPAAGTYEGLTFVEVSSATPSVELRYTLDGSEPTIASQLYEFDIQLSPPTTKTIKVKGFRSGWVTSSTSSATYTIEPVCEGVCQCAEDLNPNDQDPDDEALNCLIAAGGTVTLHNGSTGYIIATGLVVATNNVTIQGDGGERPRLIAHPSLNAPMLRVEDDEVVISGYTIRDVIFDGNRANRQLVSDICISNYPIRTRGYNLMLRGKGFTVTNIYSINALCGSAMEVAATDQDIPTPNFTISHNHIEDNGFQLGENGSPEPWADGITLASCHGGDVHHNYLEDNSDVDLIVGPGHNCQVYENTIVHTNRHAFAGLMIGFGGDHSGSSVFDNHVTSAVNGVSIGLMVGHHPWSASIHSNNIGNVSGNEITGSVVLIWVDGIDSGTVVSNTLGTPQGTYTLFGCEHLVAFAKGHVWNATIQDGAEWITFDSGVCIPGEP